MCVLVLRVGACGPYCHPLRRLRPTATCTHASAHLPSPPQANPTTAPPAEAVGVRHAINAVSHLHDLLEGEGGGPGWGGAGDMWPCERWVQAQATLLRAPCMPCCFRLHTRKPIRHHTQHTSRTWGWKVVTTNCVGSRSRLACRARMAATVVLRSHRWGVGWGGHGVGASPTVSLGSPHQPPATSHPPATTPQPTHRYCGSKAASISSKR